MKVRPLNRYSDQITPDPSGGGEALADTNTLLPTVWT
jgi:hypothetical protein